MIKTVVFMFTTTVGYPSRILSCIVAISQLTAITAVQQCVSVITSGNGVQYLNSSRKTAPLQVDFDERASSTHQTASSRRVRPAAGDACVSWTVSDIHAIVGRDSINLKL